MIISKKDLAAILEGRSHSPHDRLGMHPMSHNGKPSVVVRTFPQGAVSCEVVDPARDPEERFPLHRINEQGFFEGLIPEREAVFPYQLRVEKTNGEIRQFYDPYSFLPTISEHDLYLFNEGTERRIFEKLGAHLKEVNGVPGVGFAVWAPSARRVSVVGDFCHWDGRYFPMRSLGSSGVWEIFIPGLEQGGLYKFEVLDYHGGLRLKSDPYGKYFESPPNNASVIYSLGNFTWSDEEWMKKRSETNWHSRPISVYEVHLGSWKRVLEDGDRPLNYREIADQLVDYVKEMGYTHVEFMPLAEFPFDGSWGYQVTGFFAPTHRFGTPHDFMYLVDRLHQNDIGVLLDWVPAHFPKDAFALAEFDGTHLYEHADPRQGQHQDWGTLIFNYGRPEVRCFLVASALAWLDRYHIDGLRVDAVASMLYLDYSRKEGEWIPNRYGGRENIEAIEFLRYANEVIHENYPGALMIAEESTAWGGVTKPAREGGLGFDLKWNMGWMHDTLEYFKKDPIHRKWHHGQITFGMIYQYSENFSLVFSHDEVVHGKASMLLKMGAEHIPEKAQQLRALYGWMWGWPGKKTLFMGSDFGQSAEWSYDRSLDWHLLQYLDHEGIRLLVADLNRFYRARPSLAELDFDSQNFRWINHEDADNSVYSFVRYGRRREEAIAVVGNFVPVARHYRIGVPHPGRWREVLNTNSDKYGGNGQGNPDAIHTQPTPWNSYEQSLELFIPGMSTLFFQLENG